MSSRDESIFNIHNILKIFIIIYYSLYIIEHRRGGVDSDVRVVM